MLWQANVQNYGGMQRPGPNIQSVSTLRVEVHKDVHNQPAFGSIAAPSDSKPQRQSSKAKTDARTFS